MGKKPLLNQMFANICIDGDGNISSNGSINLSGFLRSIFRGSAYVSDHPGIVIFTGDVSSGHAQYSLEQVPTDERETALQSAVENFHVIEAIIERNGLNRRASMGLAILLYNRGLRINEKKRDKIIKDYKGSGVYEKQKPLHQAPS